MSREGGPAGPSGPVGRQQPKRRGQGGARRGVEETPVDLHSWLYCYLLTGGFATLSLRVLIDETGVTRIPPSEDD